MKIPVPKANRGEVVAAKNYRKRPPEWERGQVTALKYYNSFGNFHWSYDVRLDRSGAKGPIFL